MEHKEIQDRLRNLQAQYPNENVEQVYNSAIGFYSSVQKRWPSQQFGRVLNAEGGRLGLIHNYTLYGLAYSPDHLAGFVEYNNFVRRHYYLGEKYKMGHMASLDDVLFKHRRDNDDNLYDRLGIEDTNILNLGEEGNPLEVEGGFAPSLGDLLRLLPPQSSQHTGPQGRGKMKPLTVTELDFLETLAHVGSPSEAATLIGQTPKWGIGVVRKLRRLVATRVGVNST